MTAWAPVDTMGAKAWGTAVGAPGLGVAVTAFTPAAADPADAAGAGPAPGDGTTGHGLGALGLGWGRPSSACRSRSAGPEGSRRSART